MPNLERIGANRTVLALSVARLGDAVGNSILFIIIPLYVIHLPSTWFPYPASVRAAVLISCYGIVAALVQPVAGALSDWMGRRKIFILAGLAVMGAATLAFVAARDFTDLLVLRVVQGIGFALTVPSSMAIMTHASEKSTRGGSMGVYSTARVVGLSAGPLIGGYLYDHYGFSAAFYAGASFIGLAVFLVQIWIREVKREGEPTPVRVRIIDTGLLSPGIVGAALAIFVMAASFSMITPLEAEFNRRLHESAFAFGLAFSSLMVSRFLFQIPAGRLSDRTGRKKVIIAGLILMAPATALLGEVETTFQLIVLRMVQGIGSAGIAAPALALAADLTTAGGEGRQMSITTMSFGLGIALGPLISGTLGVVAFRVPFLIGAVMLVASAWHVHRTVPETVADQA